MPYEIERKVRAFTNEEIPHVEESLVYKDDGSVNVIKGDVIIGPVNLTKDHQRYMLGLRTLDSLLRYGNLRPYVFSSNGSLFRIDPEVLFSKNCSLMVTLFDDATYYQLADERFIFVDQNFWTVETLNAESRLQAGVLATDGSLTQDNIEPRFADKRRALEEFHGWSICFKSDEIPETSQELRVFVKPYEERRMKQRVGRPRLQEPVLTHYRRLFPCGHIGSTWNQVLAAIISDGGPSVTAATLKNALDASKNP